MVNINNINTELFFIRKSKKQYYIEKQLTYEKGSLDLNKEDNNTYVDEVVKIIRGAKDDGEAKEKLTSKFGLSEIQSNSILEMRLRRLTGLERDKIVNELNALLKEIEELKSILASEQKVLDIIKEEIYYGEISEKDENDEDKKKKDQE